MSDKPNPIGKTGKSKRRLLWSAALLVLLATGAATANLYLGRSAGSDFRTVAVSNGDIEKTVTALGSLQPKNYVDVGTQVSGQLKKVHVAIGDRVEKGQLIAEIDPAVYRTKVQSSQANLDKLQAQLALRQAEATLARQRLARNRRLLQAEAMSQDTVEENEAALKVAEAQVKSLRAEIKAAESVLEGDTTNLGYTRIYAPITGTVVAESAVEGQTVNASQSAPVIVQIADLETMTVWAQVAEADIVKVRPGMPAYFTTLGMPERRWRGQVRQVLPTPETVNDVVLYNVLIDVDNQEQLLMSKMTVQVFFLLGEAKDVPTVPLSALQATGRSDVYQARVLTPQGPQQRTVQVGLTNRTSAEVLSGLAVGDQLIVGQAPRAAAGGRQGPRSGMGPRL
ncbi:MAG TPA: efflux RND transporter periplasmic adaptor subunit [Gammaproteobacteria bacterium]|nr:efflux RND transporter periplasmic adaptor subunit [Gammaproteobacteria bacterium]